MVAVAAGVLVVVVGTVGMARGAEPFATWYYLFAWYGLLLAAVTLPAVWLALGDTAVAVAVSVALLAACSVATAVAAGLPVVMARRGVDPAFGSGPLATVVQDLLSLVIYFAVAVAVLG